MRSAEWKLDDKRRSVHYRSFDEFPDPGPPLTYLYATILGAIMGDRTGNQLHCVTGVLKPTEGGDLLKIDFTQHGSIDPAPYLSDTILHYCLRFRDVPEFKLDTNIRPPDEFNVTQVDMVKMIGAQLKGDGDTELFNDLEERVMEALYSSVEGLIADIEKPISTISELNL